MKQVFHALILLVAGIWATGAVAQSVFVQVEAHSTLNRAQFEAQEYADSLQDVNGFRIGSGWYAVALGPYDLDTAVRQINRLKLNGAIPQDSYLVDGTAYSNQFYPVGANVLAGPAVQGLPAEPADDPVDQAAAAPAPQAPEVQPQQPAQDNAAPEAPEAPVQDNSQSVAQQQPAAEPVIPEETRREALRSEGRLSRQEKFDLQIALQWFGFYSGRIDAAFGPGTRGSMAAWQRDKGYDDTGVLTTRQRKELTDEYSFVLNSIGLATLRDETAGVEVQIPAAMVRRDSYESPFAHYNAINDSGVKVLLISQTGDANSLLGLYDIMQTLKIVPLEGERSRRSNRFTITGENSTIKSYTYAELNGSEIKGFTLIWPAGEDKRFDVTLKAMRDSFEPIKGVVLPDSLGDGSLDQSIDLISGLEIRRPERGRTGFYVNGRGDVLTTTQAVAGCSRVTLDEVYSAQIRAQDEALGLALLRPSEGLAPLSFAKFQAGVPRLGSEIAVSGYSFEGMLGAPTLSFGTLADLRGLNGEDTVNRLSINASAGDAGGPVFDGTGAVAGLLLPRGDGDDRRLPAKVNFATNAVAIAEFLSNAGVTPSASITTERMAPEDLTRMAPEMTVLVSCWRD